MNGLLCKRILVCLVMTGLLPGQDGFGQKMGRFGLSGGVDTQLGIQAGSVAASLSYYELRSFLNTKFLFVGGTGRLSGFYGHDLSYYTAPARLTRGQAGLGSLTQPLRTDQIDTLFTGQSAHTSLNVGLRVEGYIGRLTIGASVDLLGFTFLRHARTDRLASSTGRFLGLDSLGRSVLKAYQGADAYQAATPQRFNVRLLGDNNRGMLTSEAYVRLLITDQVGLKASYQWVTTEVVLANTDVSTGNNRFRNRTALLAISLTVILSP